MRRGPVRLFALALTITVAVGCGAPAPSGSVGPGSPGPSGQSATAAPGASQTPGAATPSPGGPGPTAPPLGELIIPAAPPAAQMPVGTVDEQAAALATAVASSGQSALAPLLAAYGAAGMPVIDSDGESVTGTADDPLGLPWWLVWTSAGGNPTISTSLTDAAKLVTTTPDTFDLDPVELANALLDDLRVMAKATDDESRFFARFVAAMAATDGADPLDPAATTDTVMLDSIALTYLMAGFQRSVAIGLAPLQTAIVPPAQAFAPRSQAFARRAAPPQPGALAVASGAPASNPCNPSGTAEQVSFWVQWIASRIAGGSQLPGMLNPLQSAMGMIVRNVDRAAAIGRYVAWASGAIGALLFALQMATMKAVLDVPGGLTRTKSAAHHGEQTTATVTLTYDLEGSLLDGGQSIKNCLLQFLNSLGIQAQLPSDGAIPGATVILNGITGVGDYWHFPNASDLEQDTDADGVVRFQLEGKVQRVQIAQDAPEWDRNGSLTISATVEAVNERSIASTFWDSLVAPFGGIPGAIAPIIDVLKTIRYDWGEQGFLVIDWSHGWFVDQASGGGRIEGKKCYDPSVSPANSLDGSWQMSGTYKQQTPQGEQNGVELWDVTINPGGTTGHYTYTDTAVLETSFGITVFLDGKAEGDADVTLMPDGRVSMHTVDTKHTFSSHTNLGGTGHDNPAPLRAGIVMWEPGADCP